MSISGYKIKGKSRGKLKHWIPLIEEWHTVIERYCRVTKDAPYWHNERANISLLSGAAWRCGWIALEEYPSEKKHIGNIKGNQEYKKWLGRCDMYLASEHSEELVEAKFKYVSLNSNDVITTLKPVLQRACDDAEKSQAGEDISAIGVVFSVFYTKTKNHQSVIEEIEKTLETIKTMDVDCIAWSFPKETREKEVGRYSHIIPGVVMIVKKLDE